MKQYQQKYIENKRTHNNTSTLKVNIQKLALSLYHIIWHEEFCTIVSDTKIKNIRLNERRKALLQRAFPISLINKGIDLAKNIPLAEL